MAGFARISSAHRSDPGPEAVRELGSFIQEQMAAAVPDLSGGPPTRV
ncbi:hypothetical protein ACFYO5_34810 [Streptomyces sp. NPDC006259]